MWLEKAVYRLLGRAGRTTDSPIGGARSLTRKRTSILLRVLVLRSSETHESIEMSYKNS